LAATHFLAPASDRKLADGNTVQPAVLMAPANKFLTSDHAKGCSSLSYHAYVSNNLSKTVSAAGGTMKQKKK
jgi:hypothetical protein